MSSITTTTLVPARPAARARVRQDLLRLPGGRWSIWSCSCLRGAGFPAAAVLRLSSPECARLAVRLLRARGRRDGAAAALAAYTEAFAAESTRLRSELREVAADPAFREAVLWQNRRAFTHAVKPLAEGGAHDTPGETRKRELLVASYLQRYCVKNDTIGFFGPVGWARFSAAPTPAVLACGPGLISTRAAHFEGWCIDAVARTFDLEPELRPWSAPRLLPFVRRDGARLVVGSRVVRDLPPDQILLFDACKGELCAHDIARILRSRGGTTLRTDEAVYEVLEQWRHGGYIAWSFEGPRELRPERTLRARLSRIPDGARRAAALARLDEIDAAAQAVREAAGNVDALERALEHLDGTFTRVTGVAATRRGGETYAARTLMYEECRRDLQVELGADVLGRLGPPMTLVLRSVIWALHELARRQSEEIRRAFDDVTGGSGRPVSLAVFMSRLPVVGAARGAMSRIGAAVQAEMQRRWTGVLLPPPCSRQVHYSCRDLRPDVAAAFEYPPEPLFSWGRSISPDIMIDADGPEAIARGDYQFVLGEVHAVNTMHQPVFVDQHPEPAELLRSLAMDYGGPRVMWIEPKEAASHRVHFVTLPKDFGYTANRDPSPVPADRTLRTADLEVVDEGGALFVRTRDGRHRFPCLEFFSCLLARSNVNLFDLLPASAHRPRIKIDDLVVSREQWRVPAREIPFAAHGRESDRYLECQRWAGQLGLPPHVFVKMPAERKPSYVDLSSPVYVDLFCKWVRGTMGADPDGVVTITEMLPAHTGAWVVDRAGRRYTSELRIIAVAPEGAGGPGQTEEPLASSAG